MASIDLKFFNDLQQTFEKESERKDEIRQVVRELDRTARSFYAVLNQIHSDPTGKVPDIPLQELQTRVQQLAALIPVNEYYKYENLWQRTLQQAVFIIAYKHYLDTETLLGVQELEQRIGVKVNLNNDLNNFHVPVEDMLHSYITLVNELSRLAVNAVTMGDYDRPIRISKFVKNVSAGFSLLNLKNDMLRKRMDGIKYDVKKIEEIVYDITLRGLHKPPATQTTQ
ncbi:Translin [Radiomyces spectabilis]|uniref:Translin n=1 Tax=Radiomyces spectabilis TaxID=64574 RepID=UPI00221F3BE5|nr:Translin [Radiomyces spectabilis]KAI8390893.1 Translin [Radiomyces spectabilis]